MASTTAPLQVGHVHDKEADEEMDEDRISSTDADTSSWESEPNTARSTRKYHPVKGRNTTSAAEDDKDSQQQPLINGDLIIPENPGSGEQELLSSQYLRKTFGLEDSEMFNSHHIINEVLDSLEPAEEDSETVPNGYQKDGRSSARGAEDSGGTGSDQSPERDDEQGDEEVLEELDLTKEPKSVFGRMPPGMPQAQFVFMPSLGPFGASPFSSLMTGLLSSDSDGVENDADVSSQSEAEVGMQPRTKPQHHPRMDGGSEQERWEHLFGMLEQQHRQQVILQREHHERQVRLLQVQLAHLSQEQVITKQHQEPLGHSAMMPPTDRELQNATSSDEDEDLKQGTRRSPNGQEKTRIQGRKAVPPANTTTESSDQDLASEDSDETLEGSLQDASETLMTTWSSMVEQKQAQMEKDKTSNETEKKGTSERQEKKLQQTDNREEDDRFAALQKHFAEQQKQLEEQYVHQVRGMQQQWSELQLQQREQREVLSHLLSHQQERFAQAHQGIQKAVLSSESLDQVDADFMVAKDRETPTSDDTSTTYSDFTYWKQAERDTYRALPDLSADDNTRDQDGPRPDITQVPSSPQQQQQQEQQQQQQQQQGPPHSTVGQPSAVTSHTSLNPVDQRSSHLSRLSSSPRRSADDSEAGDDAQLSPSLRMNLREKHARHIADLKAYYDGELQELQTRLAEASSQPDRSPDDRAAKQANHRLKDRCLKLESVLKSANSRTEDLENTVKALEERLGETYNSTGSSVASLQQKVNDLKQLCRHKELDVQSLEKRNRELQASLDQAYQLQDAQAMDEHKDQTLLKRVVAEYKALAEKHQITKELLHDTETQLYESKAKICDLTRTLAHLELEVKRIDLDSSFVRRQGFLKSLSGTSLRSDTRPSADAATAVPQDHRGTQDGYQTTENAQEIDDILDASSPGVPLVSRSVEDRKFLKPSTNYSLFTGEEIASESGTASPGFLSDTESSLSQPDHDRRTAADRPGNLEVPFDGDADAERPLSPMMKAARQFDIWKVEESMNAGGSGGGSGQPGATQNGEHFVKGPGEDELPGMSSHRRNLSANNSSLSALGDDASVPGGRSDASGPLTPDASIHIWPRSERPGKPASPGSSKLGVALAHSSPKQLARQSLARAIRPRDHDLFPVKGSRDGRRPESPGRSGTAEAGQSVDSRPGKDSSPRRQLFAEEKKKEHKRGVRNRFASLTAGKSAADSALEKVRAGDVQTRAEWETHTPSSPCGHTPKSRTETGHDIIQRINDHQKKLDELTMEKRQLETTLSHVPISGRVSRQKRQEEERLEQRLEHVTRELGSVRMLLRRYNALKSSI